jgi:hypothetical protein
LEHIYCKYDIFNNLWVWNMDKIILMTYMDNDTNQRIVSHGINMETDEIITMSELPLSNYPHYFDTNLFEFILKD